MNTEEANFVFSLKECMKTTFFSCGYTEVYLWIAKNEKLRPVYIIHCKSYDYKNIMSQENRIF